MIAFIKSLVLKVNVKITFEHEFFLQFLWVTASNKTLNFQKLWKKNSLHMFNAPFPSQKNKLKKLAFNETTLHNRCNNFEKRCRRKRNSCLFHPLIPHFPSSASKITGSIIENIYYKFTQK